MDTDTNGTPDTSADGSAVRLRRTDPSVPGGGADRVDTGLEAMSGLHSKRTMPADFSIALRPGHGADTPTPPVGPRRHPMRGFEERSEEHTSELQSRENLVC